MSLTRRNFLGRSVAMLGTGVLARGAMLRGVLTPRTARAAGNTRSLVLLRLFGGSDGLNTVIPYTDGAYHDNRTRIGVPENQALPIGGGLGFHPRMTALKRHFDANRLAVIQGVGYPNPNLSHFRSEIIWQSADPVGFTKTGWIGRYLDTLAPAGDPSVRAVDVSYWLDHVMISEHANVFAIPGIEGLSFPTDYDHYEDAQNKRDAFEALSLLSRPAGVAQTLGAGGFVLSRNVDLYAALPTETQTTFPDTGLGNGLRNVAAMIAAADVGTIAAGVYQVGIDGFDTHAQQNAEGGHPDRWADISDSLDAFHAELTASGSAVTASSGA